MTWNASTSTSTGPVKVSLVSNGTTSTTEFDRTKTVSDAVLEVARGAGLKNFVVEKADGTEVDEDEGSLTLAETGDLKVFPEAVGAI